MTIKQPVASIANLLFCDIPEFNLKLDPVYGYASKTVKEALADLAGLVKLK